MQVSTQSIDILMEQIRRQKTMKYKGNLNTKLPFLQNDKIHLRPCIQPTKCSVDIKQMALERELHNLSIYAITPHMIILWRLVFEHFHICIQF